MVLGCAFRMYDRRLLNFRCCHGVNFWVLSQRTALLFLGALGRVMEQGKIRRSDLFFKKPTEAGHEPLGLLDLRHVPAIGYEFEGPFSELRDRLFRLRVGE